jgi:hypothetical protein
MDERAFARTAEEYAARLYAVAYGLLGNRADAEDAVQRALLKAFEARESYVDDGRCPRGSSRADEMPDELAAAVARLPRSCRAGGPARRSSGWT